MHRYQKWISVGLLALTPGIATAGALDSPQLKQNQGTPPSASRPVKKTRSVINQELADKIAKAMRTAKFIGFDITIDVRDGMVILEGFVTSAEQRNAATKIARSVPGVTGVNNRMRLGDRPSRPRVQSEAETPSTPGNGSIVRANYQSGSEGNQPVGNYQAGQPYMPGSALPTYGQYPSYPAVMYPSQNAASAWPYAGPFQPYPQAPLGWRKITMKWDDDGLWKLDFGSRAKSW